MMYFVFEEKFSLNPTVIRVVQWLNIHHSLWYNTNYGNIISLL